MLNRCIQIFLTSSLALSASASATPRDFAMSIGGASKSCTSWRGEPVKIRSDYGVGTLGVAFREADGSPVIVINSAALASFSPQVQAWWFAHECAHHQLPPQLNTENRADCRAARSIKQELRRHGTASAATFERELHALPASASGHSAGPDRVRTIIRCAGLAQRAV